MSNQEETEFSVCYSDERQECRRAFQIIVLTVCVIGVAVGIFVAALWLACRSAEQLSPDAPGDVSGLVR